MEGTQSNVDRDYWLSVMRGIRWVTLGLSILGSTLAFGFIAGTFYKTLENEIRALTNDVEQAKDAVAIYKERVRVVERRQSELTTMQARLEERDQSINEKLDRIEDLLQSLAEGAHR